MIITLTNMNNTAAVTIGILTIVRVDGDNKEKEEDNDGTSSSILVRLGVLVVRTTEDGRSLLSKKNCTVWTVSIVRMGMAAGVDCGCKARPSITVSVLLPSLQTTISPVWVITV